MTTQIASRDPIPSDILELLGPPPLLSTEDADLYHRLLAYFARSIRPEDLITWMLIKDLADHRMEIARYRRMKVDLVTAARRNEIRGEISGWKSMGADEVRKLREAAEHQKQLVTKANKPAEETTRLKKEIEDKLEADIAASEAKTRTRVQAWGTVTTTEHHLVDLFYSWAMKVERIDLLLQAAEKRFSGSLDEIDRHLRGLGRFCREQLDMIIDGEIVEPQLAGEGAAAKSRSVKSDEAGARANTMPQRLSVQKPADRRVPRLPGPSADRKLNERARRRLSGSR